MQSETALLNLRFSENNLRRLFRYFNRFMVLMWRLGFDRYFNGNTPAGYIMVLKHRGRKSGNTFLTPVNFVRLDGEIFCMAGFGQQTDWYQNVQANPDVEVWLPDGRWAGTAEALDGSEKHLLILRQLIIASGFAAPAFGLHLDRLTEQDLAKLLETYRLVRIQPKAALTGRGGPGDLAWIWPYTTIFLLLMLLTRRRRK